MTNLLRIHRLALALCRRSRWVGDWSDLCYRERWDYSAHVRTERSGYASGEEPPPIERLVERDGRLPPLPFFGGPNSEPPRPGHCRICGQPVFRGRTWRRDWRGPVGSWHAVCFEAYTIWTQPRNIAGWIAERQGGRCAYSGAPLLGAHGHVIADVEVDHFVPLWKVADMVVSWPRVLDYWGPENLRAVTSTAHTEKTRLEARERALRRARRGQEELTL